MEVVDRLAKERLNSQEGLDAIEKIKHGICKIGLMEHSDETTEEFYNCSLFTNEYFLALSEHCWELYKKSEHAHDPEESFKQAVSLSGRRQLERKLDLFVCQLTDMTWAEVKQLYDKLNQDQIQEEETKEELVKEPDIDWKGIPDNTEGFLRQFMIDGDWTATSHNKLHEALTSKPDLERLTYTWTEQFAKVNEYWVSPITPLEKRNSFLKTLIAADTGGIALGSTILDEVEKPLPDPDSPRNYLKKHYDKETGEWTRKSHSSLISALNEDYKNGVSHPWDAVWNYDYACVGDVCVSPHGDEDIAKSLYEMNLTADSPNPKETPCYRIGDLKSIGFG